LDIVLQMTRTRDGGGYDDEEKGNDVL
jgi:hypothetical protein